MVSKGRGPCERAEEESLKEVYENKRGEEQGSRGEQKKVVSNAPHTQPPAELTFK
jgi:hypothetical protein